MATARKAMPGAEVGALPSSRPAIRRLARSSALALLVAGVAIAAGHFVQSGAPEAGVTARQASASLPRDIVSLAAPAVQDKPAMMRERSAAGPETVQAASIPETEPETEPALPLSADAGLPVRDAAPSDVTAGAGPGFTPACDHSLVGMEGADATIDIVLLAACAPDAEVVLRHAGLALSARTSASGALFLSIPALEPEGRVTLRMADGTELETATPTDLTGVRRFGVQWQGDDRFQLHALEGRAQHGEPGHVWADATGRDGAGGWMAVLGDPSVVRPLMAQIYTFPAEPGLPVLLSVEAEVTGTTCGRTILGETLRSDDGVVITTDVSLAMPGCDAVGDFLVLNNLLPETTLVAAAAE